MSQFEDSVKKEEQFIIYTIQPTDTIKKIADRFGVPLDELVRLNPQVCTPKAQMGLVVKIPITDDNLPVIRFYGKLAAYYGDESPKVFSMLYSISDKISDSKPDHYRRLEEASLYYETDISFGLKLLGVDWTSGEKIRTLREERKAEIYAITEVFDKL